MRIHVDPVPVTDAVPVPTRGNRIHENDVEMFNFNEDFSDYDWATDIEKGDDIDPWR